MRSSLHYAAVESCLQGTRGMRQVGRQERKLQDQCGLCYPSPCVLEGQDQKPRKDSAFLKSWCLFLEAQHVTRPKTYYYFQECNNELGVGFDSYNSDMAPDICSPLVGCHVSASLCLPWEKASPGALIHTAACVCMHAYVCVYTHLAVS